jgi:hypothetical protein
MGVEQLVDAVRSFDGVLLLAPAEGSEFPEIAWGDYFFYFAPDGQVPSSTQPFATIVTKDYPGDTRSELDGAGRWRVNIHVGSARFEELIGQRPRDAAADEIAARDFAAPDVVLPHPVYAALGWVAVVSPGDKTTAIVLDLLRAAYDNAKARAARRADLGTQEAGLPGAGG